MLVLGALAVRVDDVVIPVAGTRRRCILALLASRVGQAVSVDAIIGAVWGEAPPPSATKTVQSHLVRLRRSLAALGDDVIATVPGGYRLEVEPDDVDACRFERLASDARRRLDAGAPIEALPLLAAATSLWRGPAYLEFDEADFARAERARLDELHLRALEDAAEAQIATGAEREAIADLEALSRTEPGREHTWELVIRALYASGRQQDALDAFARARRELVEGFGIEPGPALRALEQQVLRQDPVLAPRAARMPTALAGARPPTGRDDEVAWLGAAWAQARAGRGQVRVVSGPVGVGRTTVVAELARQAVADGGWVEHHQAAEWIAAGVSTGAVVDGVVDSCRRGPTLLVVDDAEWAGREALEALAALTAAIDPLSLLVVVVIDPSGGGQAAVAVDRLVSDVEVLSVDRLGDAAIAAIVAAEGVDDAGATAIAAVADGLPGVALLEAAAWAERAASDRLHTRVAILPRGLARRGSGRGLLVRRGARPRRGAIPSEGPDQRGLAGAPALPVAGAVRARGRRDLLRP